MTTQTLGKYSVHDTIAKGTFSRVRYCVDNSSNIPYALRVIDREKIEEEGLLETLKNEITIMKMFEHRSVVKVIDMMASPNRIFLVLDLMAGGNMKSKLYNEHFLDEREAIFYFQQLFSGVEYLHSMGITHGNLRLENILLHTNGSLKITDFSMSSILDQVESEMKTSNDEVDDYVSTISTTTNSASSRLQILKTSPHYLAPEIVINRCSDVRKAEIWSVGVILFAMTTGDLPFGEIEGKKSLSQESSPVTFYSFGYPVSEDTKNPLHGILEKIKKCRKKPFPDWISKPLKTLLNGILTGNPIERYGLYDIKSSVWMDAIPGDAECPLSQMPRKTKKAVQKEEVKESSFLSFFECFCDPYSAFVAPSNEREMIEKMESSEMMETHNENIENDDEYEDEIENKIENENVKIRSGISSRSRYEDSEPDDRVLYRNDVTAPIVSDSNARRRESLNSGFHFNRRNSFTGDGRKMKIDWGDMEENDVQKYVNPIPPSSSEHVNEALNDENSVTDSVNSAAVTHDNYHESSNKNRPKNPLFEFEEIDPHSLDHNDVHFSLLPIPNLDPGSPPKSFHAVLETETSEI